MKKIAAAMSCMLIAVMLLCSCAKGDEASAKSGVLTSVERFSLSITATDGTVYRYSIDGDTKMDSEIENLGDSLEVFSTGEYHDGIHADEVKLIKAAEAPAETVEAVYGEIVDASNANVTVLADDGNTYTVLKDDDTVVHSGSSLVIGDYIEVIYVGSLSDNSAMAHSIIVISEAEAQTPPSPSPSAPAPETAPASPNNTPAPPKETIKYVTGECVDDTMNSIVLRYNGLDYSILKDDSTVVVGNISVGDTIRVFHKGDISNGITATKITLISKAPSSQPEDFDTKKIYGSIVDSANASLTITTDNSREVVIVKNDDTEVFADLSIGTYVEISYRDLTEDAFPIAVEIR